MVQEQEQEEEKKMKDNKDNRLVSLTDKQGAAICFLQCATTIHEVWERQTKAIYHKGQWESFQGLNKDLCELASMRSVIQCDF